jgi:pyruvate dehydrogenase E2 component (dihydrolipoamide acetyltransferase)
MASDVVMPRLSDSMEEGTILKWLVDEGSEVKRGEPLVEIETDKANMTYESDTDGTLVEIVANEGDTLPIGEVIARIGEAGEAPSKEREEEREEQAAGQEAAAAEAEGDGKAAEAEEKAKQAKAKAGAAKEALGEEPATATAEERRAPARGDGDGRVKASPVARRMARDLGIELAELEGSGPGGRIVKADVEAAAKADGAKAPEREEAPEEAPAQPAERVEAGAKGEVELQDLTRLQQTVSRRMAESKATAPDFALSLEVDMTRCVELRERLKEVADPAPSFNDMVVKAAAMALREFPRVNGAYRDGKWELYSKVNVGIAVAAEDTLVVPTIFEADAKSLGEISREARALIQKVRDRKITPPEVSGGTFTVSNLGMYGIERFTAIINPPQAGLLTVGALLKKPFADERGRVSARDALTLTVVCDHRILYGADGAQFLARVRELLEQPLALAL